MFLPSGTKGLNKIKYSEPELSFKEKTILKKLF